MSKTINRYLIAAQEIQSLPVSLSTARKIRGLSIRAAAVEIGISFATVSRMERGEGPDASSALAVLSWLANGASVVNR